jgi:type IV secretory pathway VirB2 component (pilin)
MGNGNWKKWVKKLLGKIWPLFLIGMNTEVYASSSGSLPFASAMQTLQTEITKAWLPAASIILFVVTCLMLAFGEHGDGFKRLLTIVMWLSLAFGVTSFISVMFGGGAVM